MPAGRLLRTLVVTVACVLGLAACSGDGSGSTAGLQPSDPSTPIQVVASFYPLQYLVEEVGGERVSVANLTPPGAEPHDLELTPKDVADVTDATLVVYEQGLSAAVDDVVSSQAADHAWDVSDAAQLTLTYTPIEEGRAETDQAGVTDPHFWLDPVRYASVAQALAQHLADIDPAGRQTYESNATELSADLDQLDADWAAATASCENHDLVTSHNAFGYLSQRYGFHQLGITGLTPEDEPSPKDLAAAADYVREHHVTTIYYETLVSPAIADTVAAETGAATAVLDPIEGLTDQSAGPDYLAIMRANLAAVVAGQGCG